MSFISTTVPADITQSFSFKYGVANLHFIKDLAIQRKYKLETSYAIRTFTWYTVMGPPNTVSFWNLSGPSMSLKNFWSQV